MGVHRAGSGSIFRKLEIECKEYKAGMTDFSRKGYKAVMKVLELELHTCCTVILDIVLATVDNMM